MSIFIRDMKMPKDRGVFVCVLPDGTAIVQDDVVMHTTAVEVPTPHGRLIDADALMQDGWYLSRTNFHKGKYEVSLCSSFPVIIDGE